MNWLALSCASATALLITSCSTSVHESAATNGTYQTVAIDQIWAFEMPGTHDIRELEPDKFGERTRSLPSDQRFRLLDESKTFQIRAAIKKNHPSNDNGAQPGFAVLGTGAEALDGAYNVLVKGEKADETFPLDSNVTLVFFSRLAGQYVHLKRIERRDNTFEVGYQVVPHMTTNSTWHLALIPVGKLPIGKYHVQITQLPGGKDKTGHLAGGFSASEAQHIVCGAFSFSVVDRKE
ncbi:MAG: hypothetical protein U0805_11105 [Pirellulales bacterium]